MTFYGSERLLVSLLPLPPFTAFVEKKKVITKTLFTRSQFFPDSAQKKKTPLEYNLEISR